MPTHRAGEQRQALGRVANHHSTRESLKWGVDEAATYAVCEAASAWNT